MEKSLNDLGKDWKKADDESMDRINEALKQTPEETKKFIDSILGAGAYDRLGS